MTVVGKILVFLNLLLSVVVGGFVTVVYASRTHWVHEFNKLQDNYGIALASEQAYKKEVEKAQSERDGRVEAAEAREKKALADLDTLKRKNDELTNDLARLNRAHSSGAVTTEVAQKEVERRQAEFETLRSALNAERKSNVQLTLEKQQLLDRAVSDEIQVRSLKDTNGRLEQGLQELTKELARARQAGAAGSVVRASGKNPPPDNVEGLIKTADPSGLVTITIGSDAGLSKGQTLEVFRLSPVPNQSKYLGTIRILEVTPQQAVGQPTGRMAAPPRPGDRVASQILGST
jgi:hypothetical protein